MKLSTSGVITVRLRFLVAFLNGGCSPLQYFLTVFREIPNLFAISLSKMQ